MDRLPEELLCLLCEWLTFPELKRVRLVDRRWEAASTPIVFYSNYVALFSDSLDKLAALSSSRLAKHVKSLTMLTDFLPDLTEREYRSAIDFRPSFEHWLESLPAHEREVISRDDTNRELLQPYYDLPKHTFSSAQLDDGYAAYQAAMRDQKNWHQHDRRLFFTEHFARLPNIFNANVLCTHPLGHTTNSSPFWRRLRKQILVGPFDWRYYTRSREISDSGLAFLSLLEAIAFRNSFSGTKPLTRLSVRFSNIGAAPTQQGDAHSRTAPYLRRPSSIPDAFATLTELDVDIPSEIIGYIKHATRLRSLALRHDGEDLAPVHALMKDVLWPDLKRLQLSVDVSAELLLGFLKRHATTLKELYMRDMQVSRVDYVIEQLPKILKLNIVSLKCLWDDADQVGRDPEWERITILASGTNFDAPYEKSVKAYLLGESDEMPVIERDMDASEFDESLDEVDEGLDESNQNLEDMHGGIHT